MENIPVSFFFLLKIREMQFDIIDLAKARRYTPTAL